MLGENRGREREGKKKEGGRKGREEGGQIMLSILPFVAQPAVFIHRYQKRDSIGWTFFSPLLLLFLFFFPFTIDPSGRLPLVASVPLLVFFPLPYRVVQV